MLIVHTSLIIREGHSKEEIWQFLLLIQHVSTEKILRNIHNNCPVIDIFRLHWRLSEVIWKGIHKRASQYILMKTHLTGMSDLAVNIRFLPRKKCTPRLVLWLIRLILFLLALLSHFVSCLFHLQYSSLIFFYQSHTNFLGNKWGVTLLNSLYHASISLIQK